MKFRKKTKPQDNETKTKVVFAFLPVKVFDLTSKTYCWIWLERYYILEVYRFDWSSWSGSYDWIIEKRYVK